MAGVAMPVGGAAAAMPLAPDGPPAVLILEGGGGAVDGGLQMMRAIEEEDEPPVTAEQIREERELLKGMPGKKWTNAQSKWVIENLDLTMEDLREMADRR